MRITVLVAMGLVGAMVLTASAEKRPQKKENQSISVLDSTEAQWGRRSINDSIYRGYTVNAVYLERGRQRLPDSFKMYKPAPIDESNMITSKSKAPTSIKVNGKDQRLPEE